MAERRGIFGRLNDYFASISPQYKLQKLLAERDAAAASHMKRQDKAVDQILAKKGEHELDKRLDIYAWISSEDQRAATYKDHAKEPAPDLKVVEVKNEEYVKTRARLEKVTNPGYDFEILGKQESYGGKGIGAFFGRLFNGRLTESSRERGVEAYTRTKEEARFDDKKCVKAYSLLKYEKDIRTERRTMREVLDDPETVHGSAQGKWTSVQEKLSERYERIGKPKPAPAAPKAEKQIVYPTDEFETVEEWRKVKGFSAAENSAAAPEKKEIPPDALTKTPEEREKAPVVKQMDMREAKKALFAEPKGLGGPGK